MLNGTIHIPPAHDTGNDTGSDTADPCADYFCAECEQTTFDPYPHKVDGVWHWPASGGGFYEIFQNHLGGWDCTCPGYRFRGRCRHVFGTLEAPGVYGLDADETRKHKPAATAHAAKARVKLEDVFG